MMLPLLIMVHVLMTTLLVTHMVTLALSTTMLNQTNAVTMIPMILLLPIFAVLVKVSLKKKQPLLMMELVSMTIP